MSENTPAAGDPTPENLPDPAPAADEAAAPPPPPPPPPAPEIPPASDPVPPAPYAPPPAPDVTAAPGYAPAPPPSYAAAPPPAPGYASVGVPPKNPQATWALVLGILSIVCCGIFAGIPAIILGNNGKKIAEQNGVGRGMAQAGFILGIVSIGLSAVGLILRFTVLRTN